MDFFFLRGGHMVTLIVIGVSIWALCAWLMDGSGSSRSYSSSSDDWKSPNSYTGGKPEVGWEGPRSSVMVHPCKSTASGRLSRTAPTSRHAAFGYRAGTTRRCASQVQHPCQLLC